MNKFAFFFLSLFFITNSFASGFTGKYEGEADISSYKDIHDQKASGYLEIEQSKSHLEISDCWYLEKKVGLAKHFKVCVITEFKIQDSELFFELDDGVLVYVGNMSNKKIHAFFLGSEVKITRNESQGIVSFLRRSADGYHRASSYLKKNN